MFIAWSLLEIISSIIKWKN